MLVSWNQIHSRSNQPQPWDRWTDRHSTRIFGARRSYEGHGESLVVLNKTGGSHSSFDSKIVVSVKSDPENVEARVYQDDKSLVPKGLKVAISSATIGSAENMPPSSGAAPLCNGASVEKGISLTQQSKEEKREN